MGMVIKQWEWEWIPIASVLHKIHIIIMHACECNIVSIRSVTTMVCTGNVMLSVSSTVLTY